LSILQGNSCSIAQKSGGIWLSDLGNRSENSAGRGQILLILQGNSCSIAQKSGEIWTVQTDLQQIYPKSDRLLAYQQKSQDSTDNASQQSKHLHISAVYC